MVFGVTKETRWNVCFGKNQTQSLVKIELDPPKTGSILPKSIKICDNLLQKFWVYFRPTETPISAETEISLKPPILANADTDISVSH